MSFIRIYTAANTYTDINEIWDLSIDPERITGANYYSQEARKASVTMPYNETISDLLTTGTAVSTTVDTCIYRAKVEIWENFTYANENGEFLEHTRKLFWGYLFKDSIVIDTVGAPRRDEHHKVVTLIIYDYLRVLQKYLSEYPESPVLNNSPRILSDGDDIVIETELNDLWEYVPYSASNTNWPLWSRPPLVYDVDPYPDYTYDYTDAEIIRSYSGANWHFGRIYSDDTDILFEVVTVDLLSGIYWGVYSAYRVVGAGLINIFTRNVRATSYGLVITSLGVPDGYEDWDDYHIYSVPDHNAIYTITQADTEHQLILTVTGSLALQTINIIQDGQPPTLQWLNFLLSAQFAWLRQVGDTYLITNKKHYTNATSVGFSGDVKVTNYTDEFDTNIDEFSTEFNFVNMAKTIKDGVNQYGRLSVMNYPRVCSFSTNELVSAGDFVYLPEYNNNLILITEAAYNPAEPFLYQYKGRSQ